MRSLRENLVWAFAGNVIFSLCQWLVLISISKFGSIRDVGDWSLGLAVTGPIFVFSFFKLRQIQTTDAKREYTWRDYAATRVMSTSGALVVTALVVVIAYRDHAAPVILLVAAAKAFDSASDLVYGEEQRLERLDLVAISQIRRGLTSAATASFAMWATRDVVATTAATALSYAGWLYWDIRRARLLMPDQNLWPAWYWPRLRPLLTMVVPLGAVGAIGSLQSNVPRYFLDGYAGRATLGAWGAVSYLLVFGNMTVGAVANAASARLARYAAEQQWAAYLRLLRRLLTIGISIGLATVLGALLLAEPVLRLLYSDDIAAHADILVLLAVSAGLLYSYLFLGTAMDALRSYRVQPYIHVTTVTVISLSCWRLVPDHGAHGAAWSVLIGYGCECVLYSLSVTLVLRRRIRSPQ